MTAKSIKDTALTFLRLSASGHMNEAYDTCVSKNFRHHNPFFKSDRQSLLEAMEQSFSQFPDKVLEPQQVLEDGDRVVIFSRIVLSPKGPERAVVHIFRFEDAKIAELWDIGQPVPDSSPNEIGMF